MKESLEATVGKVKKQCKYLVKALNARDIAMQCGRVGSRLLLSRASDFERFLRLFLFPTDFADF